MKNMEDDIDIYEDLPNFNIKSNESLSVPNDKKTITREPVELEKQVTELTAKLQHCQKINETLEMNLFSLLRTAKAEIARKDKMIDDLRKKLDDSTFKRGAYAKTNDNCVQKSKSRYASIDVPSSPTKRKFATTAELGSPPRNRAKDQHGASTLTPITIFGERLRKRIVDEQNLEKKEKQSHKSNVDENDDENVEGYAIESDKENGSLRDTNSSTSKETHASAIAQRSDGERAKSPAVAAKDFLTNCAKADETDTRSQRKSKRAYEETNRPVSVKRIKSTGEEALRGTSEKDCGIVEFVQEKNFMDQGKFESLDNLSERLKDAVKNLDARRVQEPDADAEKCERRNVVRKCIIERRKTVKDTSYVSCEKKESARGHVAKRHNHGITIKDSVSASAFASVSDERNALHRGVEISDRQNRRIYADKRYRVKQREDDYRLRGRLQSVHDKCREEKYNRNKYHNNNKYTSHGEKFDKRYDLRTNADKTLNFVGKESSVEARITIDRTKRLATDRRVNVGDNGSRHDEYESRRPKSMEKSMKRENKKHEYSHRKCGNEKLEKVEKLADIPKRPKVSGSKKNVEKSDCLDERLGKEGQRKVQASRTFQKESSRDRADESHVDPELEDGEILTDSTNSTNKNNSAHEHFENKPGICSKSDLCGEIDNTKEAANLFEKSEIFSGRDVASSDKRRLNTNENVENLENVENVENIEKFIRNYVSTEENAGGASLPDKLTSPTTQVILGNNYKLESRVPNVDQIDSHDKKEMENDKVEKTASPLPSPSPSPPALAPAPVSKECAENVESLVDETGRASRTVIVSDTTTKSLSDNLLVPDCSKDNGFLQASSHAPKTASEENNRYDLNAVYGDNDVNERESDATKEEKGNAGAIASDSMEAKEMTSRRNTGEKGSRLRESSINVHGKVVVFARRRKPVRLANNNANMTVLMNNNKLEK